MPQNPRWQYEDPKKVIFPALAEMLAMAVFVFVGAGAAMTSISSLDPRIPLTFGLAIFVLAYSIGHISGGHINPAVTVSLFSVGRISFVRFVAYIIAHVLGALVGGLALGLVYGNETRSSFGTTELAPGVSVARGFVVEAVLTFVLLFTVNAACDSTKSNQSLVPLAIGMAVCVCHLMGVPITGCGINPARSLGSCFAATLFGSADWSHHWVYWLAPMLGGVLATVVYEFVFLADDDRPDQLEAAYRKNTERKSSEVANDVAHMQRT